MGKRLLFSASALVALLLATPVFAAPAGFVPASGVWVALDEAKQVSLPWQPAEGDHKISASFLSAQATDKDGKTQSLSDAQLNPTGVEIKTNYYVDLDTDGDDAGDQVDADDDNDGVDDGKEAKIGSNSKKADSDGDGLDDKAELAKGTSPIKTDTDGDGKSDNVD